jgi:hypothetical protein
MHIIKNIYECLIGSLLNIKEKIKDDIKIRKYMVELGIRHELALIKAEKTYFPSPRHAIFYQKRKKNLVC